MTTADQRPASAPSRAAIGLAGCLLVLAAGWAYSNSFSGPFLLDDGPAIVENQSIRELTTAFSPPPLTTASGRPLLNLSFALNYALGGGEPRGFHALNFIIHVLAGLVLFGLVRRTLLQLGWKGGVDAGETLPFALAVAALWMFHPLQTESVTYVAQRAEAMMGLFYLLTHYFFIRGLQSGQPVPWLVASVLACWLGMGSKEVMVSAPVITLLYDRTFVAGSFREAWRKRWRYFLGLATAWIPLACLVMSAGGNRGGSVGFGVGVSWWAYGLTQFQAITRYLSLATWPQRLVFEYGTAWVAGLRQVAPEALLVLALLAGTLVAIWRWPKFGFVGVWFFALLAPTSLVPGTTQMIVEHRMYLSLAAFAVLMAAGLYSVAGRRGLSLLLILALGAATLTHRRNEDYFSEEAIWSDTVAKRPGNALARNNLGFALQRLGRTADAITQYEQAIRLKPGYGEAYGNLGNALSLEGRFTEAIARFKTALVVNPENAEARNGLGLAFFQGGRRAEAMTQFESLLQLKPNYAEAHNNFGNALFLSGRVPEAVPHYREAVRLKPDYAQARNNLARAEAVLHLHDSEKDP